MSPRRLAFVATVTLAALSSFTAAPFARAQDVAIPEVANSKQSFIGRINADAVNLRSGPGDSYYATAKLDKGVEVTVVGIKFDWLKITPPEGSFSYVAKAFIDKNGDVGTVSREEVNVRTGSTLNQMKTFIQAKLDKGQQVKIVGEKDEYYTIVPPPGAYVFVNKQFVEPVRPLDTPQIAGAGAGAQQQPQPTETAQQQQPQQPAGIVHEPGTPTQDSGLRTQDSTQLAGPTTAPSNEQVAAAPATTQPSSDVLFDQLEAQFAEASTKTIEQQPIQEMLDGYNKILADAAVPESMKRLADFKVRTLQARLEVKDQFVATQKAVEETKKRQAALKAEQEEITQQLAKNEVKMYAAVGTLRTSSVQSGDTTLYRLTDPVTHRTVVYIRTSDPKYAPLIGEFIGVKGDVTTESGLNMKVITPSDMAVKVNPDDVFKKVAAQIVPPSILPQAAETASTGNQ